MGDKVGLHQEKREPFVKVFPPIRRDGNGTVLPTVCDVRIRVVPRGDAFELQVDSAFFEDGGIASRFHALSV